MQSLEAPGETRLKKKEKLQLKREAFIDSAFSYDTSSEFCLLTVN